MAYTTNKDLEQPANGTYVDQWEIPLNGNMGILDAALGGVTGLNATSGSATLSTAQYQNLILNITGVMSGNVTYTIPSGVGGMWLVRNATTGGSFTVTFASGGGGTTVVAPRGLNSVVFTDGTNFYNAVPVAGSNTQVIYNSGGQLVGSSAFYFDGTNVVVPNLYSSGAVFAVGNVTAYSDVRTKKNIIPIEDALDIIGKLKGVYYERIIDGKSGVGLIAQDVEAAVPQAVERAPDGMLGVAYGNLVGVLVEAVKELSDRVKALEAK